MVSRGYCGPILPKGLTIRSLGCSQSHVNSPLSVPLIEAQMCNKLIPIESLNSTRSSEEIRTNAEEKGFQKCHFTVLLKRHDYHPFCSKVHNLNVGDSVSEITMNCLVL